MHHLPLKNILLIVALVWGGAAAVQAANLDAERARMEQRLGAVDALKDRKMVGENNRGYLEARGTLTGPEQKIVTDENSDRRAVYAALAAKTKADIETVGRQRAIQLAQRSKPGVWLQAPNGEWREKR